MCRTLGTTLTFISVFFLVTLFAIPTVMGWKMTREMTDEMTPTIQKGSLVYYKEGDYSSGDVIVMQEGQKTHVTRVQKDKKDGTIRFLQDNGMQIVHPADGKVLGEVKMTVPAAGMIRTPLMAAIILAVLSGGCLLILTNKRIEAV